MLTSPRWFRLSYRRDATRVKPKDGVPKPVYILLIFILGISTTSLGAPLRTASTASRHGGMLRPVRFLDGLGSPWPCLSVSLVSLVSLVADPYPAGFLGWFPCPRNITGVAASVPRIPCQCHDTVSPDRTLRIWPLTFCAWTCDWNPSCVLSYKVLA